MMENGVQAADIWGMLKSPSAERLHAGGWLTWHPSELDQCVLRRAEHLPRPLAEEELEELRAAHRAWGADDASMAAIERLGQPDARVVVTGQQPGLLASPLLVLFKTLGAIDLARRLGQRHAGLLTVPVFWVASEDHDFDEVRRVFWPGHSGELEEFLLSQSSWRRGQMVGLVKTAAMVGPLKDLIHHSTFKTEFHGEVMRLIDAVYGDEQATMESGFCRLLLRLLAGTGLVIVSPLMGWVRRRAAAIFAREFEQPGESTRQIIERGEALRAAGIEPTLHRAPEAINAFWVDPAGCRHTLRLQAGEVQRALAGGGEDERIDQPPMAPGELRPMLDQDPARFSANVVTRPLIQDSVLPTVAQVVGPGEAAYLSQVEAVYPTFGVFTPVRWPRPQVTLIEPRVARNLEKYTVDARQVIETDGTQLAQAILRRELQSVELKEIDQVRLHQLEEQSLLKKKYASGVPAIEGAFDKLAQAMDKGYAKIVERMLYQRQQDEQRLSQAVAMLSNSLRPNGQPQGRQLNPLLPFAINYNLDWALRLAPLLDYHYTTPMQAIELTRLAIPHEVPSAE